MLWNWDEIADLSSLLTPRYNRTQRRICLPDLANQLSLNLSGPISLTAIATKSAVWSGWACRVSPVPASPGVSNFGLGLQAFLLGAFGQEVRPVESLPSSAVESVVKIRTNAVLLATCICANCAKPKGRPSLCYRYSHCVSRDARAGSGVGPLHSAARQNRRLGSSANACNSPIGAVGLPRSQGPALWRAALTIENTGAQSECRPYREYRSNLATKLRVDDSTLPPEAMQLSVRFNSISQD